MNIEMGKRIKQARLDKGMTLRESGECIGVSESAFSRYEAGNVDRMRLSTVESLANLFEVSTGYLLGWEKSDELTELYIDGILSWIDNDSFTIAQQNELKNHFWELLLKYKILISRTVNSSSFSEYLNTEKIITVNEIAEAWNERLDSDLKNLSEWIYALPTRLAIAHTEDYPADNTINIQTLAAHKIGEEDITEEELKLINRLLQEHRESKKKEV